MPKTVVAIHGVGSGEHAATGRAVAQNLGFRAVRQTTIYADGQALLEFTDEDTGDSVIEVNWEDILKPKSTAIGLLRHISYLVTSMLDVALREMHGKFSPICGRLYRLALLTLTPGAVLFTLATAVAVSIPGDVHRGLILLTLLIAAMLLAVWLWRLGQHLVGRLLWIGIIGLIATVLVVAFYEPINATHFLVNFSGLIRIVGFGGVILILVFAAIECWVRLWKQSLSIKLAHMSLLYLPLIVINGLMTWFGVLALSYISNYPNYQLWEKQMWNPPMTSSRWALIEVVTTLVFGGLVLFALLLPGLGYLRGAEASDGNRRGQGARNGMNWFLAAAPISLILLLVFTACTMGGMFPGLPEWVGIPEGINILEIYQISVLRTLPYLAWLIGPSTLVLDILGDVVFYLQPNNRHPAAIAEQCRIRLEAAINFAKRKTDDSPEWKLVVLANSQGSKIAADLRNEGKVHYPLVTTGSPVSALYLRFLGVEIGADQSNENAQWVNCYRDGDVIAGSIEHPGVENRCIGRGGHTGYWSDQIMATIICNLAKGQTRAPLVNR